MMWDDLNDFRFGFGKEVGTPGEMGHSTLLKKFCFENPQMGEQDLLKPKCYPWSDKNGF